MIQRAWRYKRFRKYLRILVEESQWSAKSKQRLYEELELMKRAQAEEKRKREETLAQKQAEQMELERRQREQAEHLVHCVVTCQRAIRMKRFRKYFKGEPFFLFKLYSTPTFFDELKFHY
jgi:hypothetical protein